MTLIFFVKSVRFLRYFRSVVEAFLLRGWSVRVVFDASKTEPPSDDSLERFRVHFPRFSWSIGPLRSGWWARIIISCRNLRNYRFLVRKAVVPWRIKRHREYLPLFLQRYIARAGVWGARIVCSRAVDFLCRCFEFFTPLDRRICAFLQDLAPSVVLVSYRSFPCLSPDIDYVKAARALGVPTALVVPSWDQPTTKSLIQVESDRVFVWNEEHRQSLMRDHRVLSERIAVVGAPQFDRLFARREPFESRVSFARTHGISADRTYVLYIVSSGEKSDLFAREIASAMAVMGEHLRDLILLVRPYPGSVRHERLSGIPRIVVLPAPAEGRRSFDDDRDFFDAVFHSCAVITLTSTAALDAAVIGRPCIVPRDVRFSDIQGDEHLLNFFESGAFYCTRTMSELLFTLSRLTGGNDPLGPDREAYLMRTVRPQGIARSAADVLVSEVEQLL
jgi:hypothetical protein